MPTLVQLEEQIYACEGFRVQLKPLKASEKKFPSYDFLVMAPQKWRISDWKTVRLRAFVTSIREITVLRGDGKQAKSNIQLGSLRDTYYQAKYGSLAPEEATTPATVTPLPEGKRQ